MSKISACVSRIITVYFLFAGALMAEEDWAQAPANITIGEFLEMHFASQMGDHESDALNSFNLVSFYPTKAPDSAFVLVIQGWNDSRVAERDLRREIRKVGDAMYGQFNAIRRHPTVRKRWPLGQSPEPHLIIKHVRKSDLKEVLGVTVDGVTSFDEEAIKKAETSVKQRGGVWSF